MDAVGAGVGLDACYTRNLGRLQVPAYTCSRSTHPPYLFPPFPISPLPSTRQTFMEFAVVGMNQSTLAGSHPLQPWGQDPEVISGFPAAAADGAETVTGRGKGDGSFVQGLGEFCFPCGASMTLVEAGAAVSLSGFVFLSKGCVWLRLLWLYLGCWFYQSAVSPARD